MLLNRISPEDAARKLSIAQEFEVKQCFHLISERNAWGNWIRYDTGFYSLNVPCLMDLAEKKRQPGLWFSIQAPYFCAIKGADFCLLTRNFLNLHTAVFLSRGSGISTFLDQIHTDVAFLIVDSAEEFPSETVDIAWRSRHQSDDRLKWSPIHFKAPLADKYIATATIESLKTLYQSNT